MPRIKTREVLLHCAASEYDADLLYLTGFSAPDAFWFLNNGEPTIFLSDLEIDRARRELRGITIKPWSVVCPPQSKKTEAEAMADYLLRCKISRVTVPRQFPLGLAQTMNRRGVKVDACAGPFLPRREFKTTEEIACLKKAQSLAQTAMRRAREILASSRPGKKGRLTWHGKILTSEVLRGEIQACLARLGAAAHRVIVACGDQACDPHEAGSGPLRAGEMIIVDIFPRVVATGYWGDITRTFCVGSPRPEAARLHATVCAAQKMALEKIRPACDGKKLQQEVRDFFTASGFVTGVQDGRHVGFFHGLGHGVGLEIHEAPRIAAGKLRAGHVITVEPGLYYPGLGAVRIEDMGVVTATGFENFTSFPKSWKVRV